MRFSAILSMACGSKSWRCPLPRLRHLVPIALVFASFTMSSETARNAPQRQAEAELLALHQADRRAHFAHDVDAVLAHTAPQLLDVRDGKTTMLTRDAVRTKFAGYFRHADFSAWDDVEPPVIRVSSDGRMGWMIVRVHIVYVDRDTAGKPAWHDETAAWMSAYEKRKGNWLMTAVTSTFAEH
jgi:hypothetical protein